MTPENYAALSDKDLMALCVWREARGEGILGQRGVAHCIKNRADDPMWWGHDIRSVILKPFQFSSFNVGDPNEKLWPLGDDPQLLEISPMCDSVLAGTDKDITDHAQFYHDVSVTPPWAEDYILTLQVGRLLFYKL
jgi:spore germination cell wall hydrolase CwlJ-like protein